MAQLHSPFSCGLHQAVDTHFLSDAQLSRREKTILLSSCYRLRRQAKHSPSLRRNGQIPSDRQCNLLHAAQQTEVSGKNSLDMVDVILKTNPPRAVHASRGNQGLNDAFEAEKSYSLCRWRCNRFGAIQTHNYLSGSWLAITPALRSATL